MSKKYVVYLTYYKGDKLPQWYIGSSSEEKVKKGYNGTVLSKEYKKIYDIEQKQNKHLFKTKILSYHNTREEALKEEKRLQKNHEVVKNTKYINKSYAQEKGFFGMEVKGSLNPNYANKWDEDQKEKMSKQRKGKALYIDVDGITRLFDIISDKNYIESNNLRHINKGKKYSDEVNYKKGSGFRGKKRPEHAEKISGMNCYKAKLRGIYNSEDELVYDVSGSLRKSIKKYNLPSSLEKATKDNPLNYYKNKQVLSVAKNNGYIKYNGWYVDKLQDESISDNKEENIVENRINEELTEKEKKRGIRSLRKAAKRAAGQIQNFVGDYCTNYELVKKGYAQLPIGLFATDYNYDNFDSMEDIQIAVLDDMEEGTEEKADDGGMMKKIQDMMDQADSHLDSNNEDVTNPDKGEGGQEGGGSAGPMGAPDFADDPDEDDIAEMTPEELADMLDKMAQNQGGGEGAPLDEEDAADMQAIQDAIEDKIEEIMNDPNVSEEEKEKIQEALDKQQASDSNPGNSQDGSDKKEDGQGQSSKGGTAGNELKDEEKSLQDKIDDAMKDSAEDSDSMSAEEREELNPQNIEEKIKELEEEAAKEEEERMEGLEAAKAERRKQREAAAKAEGELKKPAKPIDWKTLLKKMVPKPIEIEEESITRMHNRTKSALAAALDSKDNDGVAVKAGIIKDEKNEQKLLFVLDNSGSMAETISGVNPDILRVIEKSKKMGVKDMYIIKFDSDWDVYKIDLDPKGKNHKFRQFKNQKDIVKKAKDLNDESKVNKLLTSTSKPIAELFKEQWGGGTTFPVEMSKIILELVSGKSGNFNGVMFTDTDILGAGNVSVLQKIAMKAAKRPFSFNIILDSQRSFNAVKPKLSGYKYISYIGDKKLQE